MRIWAKDNGYLAAKSNSKRRFHALYDKVYRKVILLEAWRKVKSNGGAGGIERIDITDAEKIFWDFIIIIEEKFQKHRKDSYLMKHINFRQGKPCRR